MFHLLWLSDQILSALIVGFFSLSATAINLVISGRRNRSERLSAGLGERAESKGASRPGGKGGGKSGAKAGGKAKKGPVVRKERARMRTLVLLGGWAVAAAFLLGDLRERWRGLSPLNAATAAVERMGAFQPPWAGEAEAATDGELPREDTGPGLPTVGVPAAGTGSPLAEALLEAEAASPADAVPVPEPASDSSTGAVASADPAAARSAWLRADGLTIRYHYASYLPTACSGRPAARGSWNGGWETAAPVTCLDDAWLALDLAPLVEAGRISFNVTYCVNFQDPQGAWGRHGGAEPAPGWAEIAVPAEDGVPGTLGFRVVRGDTESRVVFTAEFPRAAC